MPKNINHEERRQLILRTALDVFARNGYRNTNLTLVAQECGLSRTTVYQYFKSVDDVLIFAVKKVTDSLFDKYTSSEWQGDSSPFELLQRITSDILDAVDCHVDEIANFVMIMKNIDLDLRSAVHRRTANLSLMLSRLIRHGQNMGQIRKCSAHDCVLKIIILIESYCFQLVFFEDQTTSVRELIDVYLDSLKA